MTADLQGAHWLDRRSTLLTVYLGFSTLSASYLYMDTRTQVADIAWICHGGPLGCGRSGQEFKRHCQPTANAAAQTQHRNDQLFSNASVSVNARLSSRSGPHHQNNVYAPYNAAATPPAATAAPVAVVPPII
jgi:hypothetical protein